MKASGRRPALMRWTRTVDSTQGAGETLARLSDAIDETSARARELPQLPRSVPRGPTETLMMRCR
jgi:hypothetical protein